MPGPPTVAKIGDQPDPSKALRKYPGDDPSMRAAARLHLKIEAGSFLRSERPMAALVWVRTCLMRDGMGDE